MDSPFKDTILQGKVGLITGGGSGLGLEIAVQYGLHGCKVALMGRREQVLRKAVEDLQAQGIQVKDEASSYSECQFPLNPREK